MTSQPYPGSPPGGGMGSTSPGAGTDPHLPSKPGTPGGASPMVTEQRFLEGWFKGTPVVIAAQAPSTLQLEVPLPNSFDAGKADIKPALNAVLDRVAESLRRQAGARIAVAAPADSGSAASALAQSRTQSVRDALVAKRIAITRIQVMEPPRAGSTVQLRLTIPLVAAAPIARRNDSAVPVPVAPGGVKPVVTKR